MARNIATIFQQIVQAYVANAAAVGITIDPTQFSLTNIQQLWANTVASAEGIEEQLYDSFISDVEAIVAAAAVGSPQWIQSKVFQFQYDAVNPQIIQLINGVPQYPQIIPEDQIITRCSVTPGTFNSVNIKVATGNPPMALNSPQLDALRSYINPPNGLGIAGITYNVSSNNPDQLYCQVDVYYLGQYSAIILTNLTTAFNNYLTQISNQPNFGGLFKLSDLEGALRSVAGVNDIAFKNVSARKDSVAFGSGTPLVNNYTELSPTWQMVAGYMIGETTSGQTFANTVNLIAQ
jgi:hypothetical protein